MTKYRTSWTQILEQVNEGQSHTVRYTDPLNKKRFAIPYKTHADAEKKMAQLKKDGVKEIQITMDTLKPNVKFKEEVEIKEQNTDDHEVSMARGELEAIADKALALSSILKDKSEAGNPIEAWVQSKITKSADMISTIYDYMVYNPEVNEEHLQEAETSVPERIAKLRIRQMMLQMKLNNMDKADPKNKTPMAIAKNDIENIQLRLDQLRKQQGIAAQKEPENDKKEIKEEPYGWTLVSKAKDLAKKFAGNMTKAYDEIEKLAKDLSKNNEVQKALRQYNEELKEEIKPEQLKKLKDTWADLKTIPFDKVKPLRNFLDRHSTDSLMQLAQANINFVSNMARSVMNKRKMGDPKHSGSMREDTDRPTPNNPNPSAISEQIEGLKNKSEKSGISYGILKQVYDRGMAAWKGGHRPGTTPQQWAFARVNSFITKGKTYYTADADLAKKAGKK